MCYSGNNNQDEEALPAMKILFVSLCAIDLVGDFDAKLPRGPPLAVPLFWTVLI